jgi:hypothetical protein
MRCHCCNRMMISRSSQTLEEEDGALIVTSLWCRACDHVIEEIWTSSRFNKPQRQVRYRVASPVKTGNPLAHQARTRREHSLYACSG